MPRASAGGRPIDRPTRSISGIGGDDKAAAADRADDHRLGIGRQHAAVEIHDARAVAAADIEPHARVAHCDDRAGMLKELIAVISDDNSNISGVDIRKDENGEWKEETEWFSVVAWEKLAEQCNQFLTKGRLVYIEGRLRLRTWEGQDGKTRARNEIIAEKVKFLDRQGAPAATGEAKPDDVEPAGDVEPDDIPF